jgi:hypothetical protein
VTDVSITGRLARFGSGEMIEDVSSKLLRDFATRLGSGGAAPSGAEITAGEAAPEEVLAAAPEPSDPDATAG